MFWLFLFIIIIMNYQGRSKQSGNPKLCYCSYSSKAREEYIYQVPLSFLIISNYLCSFGWYCRQWGKFGRPRGRTRLPLDIFVVQSWNQNTCRIYAEYTSPHTHTKTHLTHYPGEHFSQCCNFGSSPTMKTMQPVHPTNTYIPATNKGTSILLSW